MFTPKQVDEIFNEVDTDKSNTVDFYEVLVVSQSKMKSNDKELTQ